MGSRSSLRLALLLILASGCAHYPVNTALTRAQDGGYRFDTAAPPAGSNTDSLFVCLTFSGGGTRAAALAYGVMEKLRSTPIVWEGVAKRLLDEVDCISSVSGGSFTAAYYGLFGERLFTDFRARFLDRNIEDELVKKLFNPVTLFRLASPYFSRSDLAAEHYHRTIFEQRTFADLLAARRRPFIILNATNLATGDRFEFTQDQFEFLGSDLAPYPVARAVTASSAFPILLSPISLWNHPSPPGYAPPETYVNALKDYDNDRRRYQWAHSRMSYLDRATRPYLHLADGGLADNIGLRSIQVAYRESSGFIRWRINDRLIKRLVIIVVNARTDPQEHLSLRERAPGALAVGLKAATISMGNYSFETIELMKEMEQARRQAQQDVTSCQEILDRRCPGGPRLPALAELKTCFVEVNFEAIADEKVRRRFLDLPTNFHLEPEQIQALIGVGQELLDTSPAFQRLLKALGRGAGSSTSDIENCN